VKKLYQATVPLIILVVLDFEHSGFSILLTFWSFRLSNPKRKLDAAWANTSRPQWNIFNSKMYVCNKPLLNPTENERASDIENYLT
jgi:hypothetical protein